MTSTTAGSAVAAKTPTTATVATKATTPAPAKAATTIPSPALAPAPALKNYALRTPAASTVTATQYLGIPDAAGQFAGHATREDPLHQMTLVLVQTADGGRPAFPGDWIVTDSQGNASVMKDTDFCAKYSVDKPVAAAPAPTPAPVVPKPAPKPAPPVAAPVPVDEKFAASKPVKEPAPVKKPVHDILT